MKEFTEVKILENSCIHGVYSMTILAPEIAKSCVPGQFINLYTGKENMLLPRPISICLSDAASGEIRLVYQVIGAGTKLFSEMKAEHVIKVLGPLGNGYEISERKIHTLIGGGIGVPPLLFLAKTLRERYPDCRIEAFLGFRSQSFLTDEFEALGVRTLIATDDGSQGFKGNAVEMLRQEAGEREIVYSCGPKPMLHAVEKYAIEANIPYQLSLEERMACGLGACVGCVVKIKTPDGYVQKKVCSDGPVFCFGAGEQAFTDVGGLR